MIETEAKYAIRSLGKQNSKEFCCGIPELDRYLQTQANQDIEKNVSVTYVLTEQGKDIILGYYSISTIGIFPGELPDNLIDKLPRYPMLPGVLLGKLAIDQKYKGQGFGSFLLMDAFNRILMVSKQIKVVAVIADAKNEAAVGFYQHAGFIALPDNKFKLFLPLKVLKSLNL